MICPKCHAENNDNLKYCISCGEPLNKTNQSTNQTISENELKNPSIVEKNINTQSPNDIFGLNEEYIVRSNATKDEVLTNNAKFINNNNNNEIIKDNSKYETQTIYTNNNQNNVNIENNVQKEKKVNDNRFINETSLEINSNITSAQQTVNDIVNPVSPIEKKKISDRVNPIVLIGLLLGAFFRPGTTIKDKTKVFTKTKSGLHIYISFSTLILIAFMVSNVINGCFNKIYDINTGTYNTSLDFTRLSTVNYLNLLVIGFLLSFGIIMLVTLVYYIASFITNRGLTFGRYLTIITLCLLPFLICTCLVAPIVSIPSYYLGIVLTLFGIVYSFIIIITILNDVLTFKNTNQKIMYHAILLSIIFVIVGIIITLFLRDQLSTLKIIF